MSDETMTGDMVTMSGIMEMNETSGRYFFSPDTLRFFGSRIHSRVYTGGYFVTSELGFNGNDRRYSVRAVREDGSIDTVSEFRQYATSAQAHAAAKFQRVLP